MDHCFELFVIAHRNAQHLGGNDGGHRRGQILHDVRAPLGDETVDQAVRYVLNMPAQDRDAGRSERPGAKVSEACVIGRIPEQHLPGHNLNDRVQRSEPHLIQLLRRGCTVGRETAEDSDDVRIAGYYPGMQESIPMHRIGFPQLAK
jgi:hypothetical protein